MRIRQLTFLILCFLAITLSMYAQSYDKLWKQVEEAQQKDLPQTVVSFTEQIFQKAQKEKKSPQMFKAWLTRMQFRRAVMPHSFYADLHGLEEWARESSVALDRMILHTLLAELYTDFYQENSWRILAEERVGEAAGSELRTWTTYTLTDTILSHIRGATEDPDLLLKTSSRRYEPFIVQGESSVAYHHDMYHLLVLRQLNALQRLSQVTQGEKQQQIRQMATELTDRMAETYRSRNSRDGVLLTRLLALTQLKNQNFSAVWEELARLAGEYRDSPWGVEVWIAWAQLARESHSTEEMLRIAREGMDLYPDHPRTEQLRQWVAAAVQPSLSLSLPAMSYSGEELAVEVTYKNVREVTVEFYKLPLPAQADPFTAFPTWSQEELTAWIEQQTPESYTYPLKWIADFVSTRDTLRIQSPGIGSYAVRLVHPGMQKDPAIRQFSVSDLRLVVQPLPDGLTEIFVLDARTGCPVVGADILVYNRERDADIREATFRTDSIGRISFPWKETYYRLTALRGEDRFLPLQNAWPGRYVSHEYHPEMLRSESQYQLSLLTDRVLYRPGQTVFVKGILYALASDSAQVVSGVSQEITLEGLDRQWRDTRQVFTNEYGSFTTEFVLPADLSPGSYLLSCHRGQIQIQVEEYKRPTFTLFFDTPQVSYQLGDSLQLQGTVRTFSGVALSGQPVHYTVSRSYQWGWVPLRGQEQIIASGQAMPDSQGRFSVPVYLERGADLLFRGYSLYEIKATFTSPSGETQEARTSVRVGERSLLLSAEIPDNIRKDIPFTVTVGATNLGGMPMVTSGMYALYPALSDPAGPASRYVPGSSKADRSRYAAEPVCTGNFTTNRESILGAWQELTSGHYLLSFTAWDSQDREVTLEKEILLFSTAESRPPISRPLWYVPLQTEFGPSQTASFLIGTSEKEACIILDVFSGNQRLEIRHLHLSDSVMRFDYPYQKSYGNGITLSFLMLRDGELYEQQVTLTRRMQPKNLELHWETFRDKLRPGQEETWKLTLRDPYGKAADAEMLALMYDASLDKILPYNQQLRIPYRISAPYFNRTMVRYSPIWLSVQFPQQRFTYPQFLFDGFLQPCQPVRHASNSGLLNIPAPRMMAQENGISTVRGISSRQAVVSEVAVMGRAMDYAGEVSAEEAVSDADNAAAGGGQLSLVGDLRTQFHETAFFYPQLQTNTQGEIVFTFTLPESLTTWHFRGFAHTREMLTGMVSSSITASKEFMVMSHLPRFVRIGDETVFAATLANQSDHVQSGTVTFTLFDPVTEKVIHIRKKAFSVGAGKNIGVDFCFTATAGHDLLGCRITAESSTFSDGEQHLLPVLPNRERVTETVPMPIRGGETREFALDSLFNNDSATATDRRLTTEFSGNPAWYAIQALPPLSNPQEENALSLSAAWYANSVAAYILDRYPRMQQIVENWRQTGKESFLSHLQTNQELKNILLSESPWILEARTEQEQMERLSTLFDLNQIRYTNHQLLGRLQRLQASEGSWSWYTGMSPGYYTTLGVMEHLIRRKALTGSNYEPEVVQMMDRGWKYLHAEALKLYQHAPGEEGILSADIFSSSLMQYLYLVALSGEAVPAASREAYDKIVDLLPEQITRLGVIDKARAAIVLQAAGRTKQAGDFTRSLSEYLVRTDSRGAYFAFNESRASWWGQPMSAHVITLEAIDRVAGDTALVEEMKMWLLAQKQTRQWRTPVATVNAVYALLYHGSNPLDNPGDVRITLGSHTLHTMPEGEQSALPTAYIQESFTDPADIADMKKAVVEKRDPGFAWGGIYAQYQEDISKINRHGEELQVEKYLYAERYEGSERKLIALTEQTPLRVGDRVVCRLILRVDRPMDFVQLTDQRAACFEPVDNLSGYRRGNQVSYFVSVRDASTRFFFDTLDQGVYKIEYTYLVNRAGSYESGLATLQSAYAPEYAAHAPSGRLMIDGLRMYD